MAVEAAPRASAWKSIARLAWRVLATPRRVAPVFRVFDRQAALRARELLFAYLTPAQRQEIEQRRAFTVRGQSGQLYRIGVGSVANIEVLDEAGRVGYRLCACPQRLPTWGVMLAQKLMLESREAEFLGIAVRHPAMLQLDAQRRAELDDVHVDGERAVVADHVEPHAPAGRRGEHAAVEGPRGRHGLVVASDDEIAFAQSGVCRRAVGIERADAHPGRTGIDQCADAAGHHAVGVVSRWRTRARRKDEEDQREAHRPTISAAPLSRR